MISNINSISRSIHTRVKEVIERLSSLDKRIYFYALGVITFLGICYACYSIVRYLRKKNVPTLETNKENHSGSKQVAKNALIPMSEKGSQDVSPQYLKEENLKKTDDLVDNKKNDQPAIDKTARSDVKSNQVSEKVSNDVSPQNLKEESPKKADDLNGNKKNDQPIIEKTASSDVALAQISDKVSTNITLSKVQEVNPNKADDIGDKKKSDQPVIEQTASSDVALAQMSDKVSTDVTLHTVKEENPNKIYDLGDKKETDQSQIASKDVKLNQIQINYQDHPDFNDKKLMQLLQENPNVEVVELINSTITGFAFTSSEDQILQIKELNLTRCKFLMDQSVQFLLNKCVHLKKLNLNGTTITGEALAVDKETLDLLTELDLSHCKKLTDTDVSQILRKSPNLERLKLQDIDITGSSLISGDITFDHLIELDLSGCSELLDENARSFLKKCPRLQILKLNYTDVSGEAFESGKVHLDELVELDLSGCSEMTEESAAIILKKCPQLKKLILSVTDVTGEAFGSDGVMLDNLVELDLTNCSDLKDQSTSLILKKCPNLRILKLTNTDITGRALASLPDNSLNKLIELDLIRCFKLSEENTMSILKKCSGLKIFKISMDFPGDKIASADIQNAQLLELDLSKSEKLSDTNLNQILKKFPHLTSLNLSGTIINGKALALDILQLDQLTELDLSGCDKITEENLDSIFMNFVNLKKLKLCNTTTTGSSLLNNALLEEMSELSLRSCKKLTNENIHNILDQSPHLKILNLWDTDISGEVFALLKEKLNHLVELNLTNCKKIKDEELKFILNSCPHLTKLDLGSTDITGEGFVGMDVYFNHLNELDLSDCGELKNDFLKSILKIFPNLQKLKLNNTQVTGKTLTSDEIQLNRLTKLFLDGCEEVDETSLQELEKKYPHLQTVL